MKRLSRRRTRSAKETLEDIFEGLLKDIYWAEKHLLMALPKLAKASFSADLRKAFNRHVEETKAHVIRLEECFNMITGKPASKKCDAMKGLVTETLAAIEKHDRGHTRDAALIASAQKIEHYEISAYGTLRTIATVLEKDECARMLEETKNEEVAIDIKLTDLAARINHLAAEFTEVELSKR